ncbi:MAG: fimbrial protein [Calothrix sp. SM1_7_51]|nr:fimbrial protein [Calothrix sp. SM1_7_51]
MYGLDVNFLKDRSPAPKSSGGNGKRASVSSGGGSSAALFHWRWQLVLSLPIISGVAWWFLETKNAELDGNIAQLEQENQRLETEIGNINKLRTEITQIKSENQALVSVFDQIRPWSAMLQDMRERIPAPVQIENIEQIAVTPPAAPATASGAAPTAAPVASSGVRLTGMARSFNDVNDFLLILQQSRFFKASESKIVSAELVDAPIPAGAVPVVGGVPVKPLQIVKYTIQSNLSDIPASELMRELEQKGTVGLVSRIRSLQKQGVLKQ